MLPAGFTDLPSSTFACRADDSGHSCGGAPCDSASTGCLALRPVPLEASRWSRSTSSRSSLPAGCCTRAAIVAERDAAVGVLVEGGHPGLDPVIAGIITAAGRMQAWQLAHDRAALQRLRRLSEPTWDLADVLVPSTPQIPDGGRGRSRPHRDQQRVRCPYERREPHSSLSALTLPVGIADGWPPPSVTLVAPSWREDSLLGVAARLLSRTGRHFGERAAP